MPLHITLGDLAQIFPTFQNLLLYLSILMKIDPGLLKVPFGHKIIINQWALTSFCNHAPISKICPLGGLFFEKIIVINKFIVVQY